ncbi:hypothetical protein [Luteolibacter luteus]|uniref:Outer-membrane lipoprotein LolB n=1 Tax=Luteolibacter luteus TaxID=2728835 RepID=A0A858RQA5_9BACT|nr:hypothetical protein [Luteolibacter luteus]QJE98915.1 hypothetical protein HHL09_25095 [Luteolibacter luteus]
MPIPLRPFLAPLLVSLLPGCAAIVAKKHTYGSSGGGAVNGAQVALRVKPEGNAGGSFVMSAMVVSGGMATLDGPFRWRIEANGEPGKQESLMIHRLRTKTALSKQDEWYPAEKLQGTADFRMVKDEPGRSRAVYEIPGLLQVKPREDGALEVFADLSVKSGGRWERKMVKFHLDPTVKREDEFIFLPAEIVKSIGEDPADWQNSGWD